MNLSKLIKLVFFLTNMSREQEVTLQWSVERQELMEV